MSSSCPHLASQIAHLRRIYTHLEDEDLRQMRALHYCDECPEARKLPSMGRDPLWDTQWPPWEPAGP